MKKLIGQLINVSAITITFMSIFINPIVTDSKSQFFETAQVLSNKNNCDKTTNPNAPCRGEAFQKEETLTKSSTKTVTCGINIFTATGTKVATISETVTFTIGASTIYYKVNSASRSTWVKNSSYQWKNLNGPSPSSGSDIMFGVSGPSTYGDLHFLGGYWNTWRTTLVVNSASSWYCR